MHTFTAKELSKTPAKVFRTVDKEGSAKINHDRYPDKVFIIKGKDRGSLDDTGELVFIGVFAGEDVILDNVKNKAAIDLIEFQRKEIERNRE